ncbi:Uncharacterized conserved protein, DUF1330 family [Parasphingorhabdus marina DSM 22363]|uniref:Uncharacterized conserved protein, DUF1330 family n=1 Tax=Parasphingorhabdus marina DSM 22363 TaxID=1123272 RepID=A0A1N6CUQ6_9SPHN|nr:DUF1330 domain-containing protein [Parasphingorhabdus marina]SIN62215.1 Uncharacterized conserved protein, DUF1330 family [Parasphingorhabdus marina DSM 22363]
MQVINQIEPSPKRAQEFFGAAEDGPFIMVNLLKFKDKAEYDDGSDNGLSGRDAYLRYGMAVAACLQAVGAKPLTSGMVTGLMLGEVEELWDMVALVQYPSLSAFRNMVESPEYQAIQHHRQAGLEGQLNIKIKSLAG